MGLTIAGVNLDDMKSALLQEAERKAKNLEKRDQGGRSLTTGKLRSYYKTICSICRKLEEDPNRNDVWIEFYMLKAKVDYDKKRKVVNEEFASFIKEAVDNISKTESVEDLKKFRLFFEAVVGFFPRSTAN